MAPSHAAMPPQIISPKARVLFFDLDEVKDLKHCYEETIRHILEELPPVNWNSIPETKAHFAQTYMLALPDTKISTLKEIVDGQDQDFGHACIDELIALIELKKTQYAVRNYLDCIIKHQVDGKLSLREVNGIWMMPNKQPNPTSPDILACIVNTK